MHIQYLYSLLSLYHYYMGVFDATLGETLSLFKTWFEVTYPNLGALLIGIFCTLSQFMSFRETPNASSVVDS